MCCEIGTAYGALSCLLARNGAPLVGVWGFSPQEKVSVPLAKYIYLVVFTGRQELSLCHYAPFPSPPPPPQYTEHYLCTKD